jgi:hypothetical protein
MAVYYRVFDDGRFGSTTNRYPCALFFLILQVAATLL